MRWAVDGAWVDTEQARVTYQAQRDAARAWGHGRVRVRRLHEQSRARALQYAAPWRHSEREWAWRALVYGEAFAEGIALCIQAR